MAKQPRKHIFSLKRQSRRILLAAALLAPAIVACAQQPTPFPVSPVPRIDSAKAVQLIQADVLQGIQSKNDSGNLDKLIGNVILKQGTTLFYCDSAIRNASLNIIDAYGHIHINQADSVHTYSDYLHYLGNEKKATLRNNVKMTDGTMVLTTPQLDYDLNTHVGIYSQGGKLVTDSTVLTSRQGYYYSNTKDAYFKNNVKLTDPQYVLTTDTLLYNTVSKIATFVAPTAIHTGSADINTTCGYYDTEQRYAHLCSRSSIVDSTQHLSADTLNYDKTTGVGVAKGNVVWTDTLRNITVLSNYAVSNSQTQTILAIQHPVMILMQQSDTLYLAADTLFSGMAPPEGDSITVKPADMLKDLPVFQAAEDSIAAQRDAFLHTQALLQQSLDSAAQQEPAKKKDTAAAPAKATAAPAPAKTDTAAKVSTSAPAAATKTDSLAAPAQDSARTVTPPPRDSATVPQQDSTAPRFIIAYHHVKLFSDSMQGLSDSLYYSDRDSVFRFYHDPILWVSGSQLTGDTILLHTRNQGADRIDLLNNALIVNDAGSGFYNQIKGNIIYGYFKENRLDWMQVNGNAETVYFAKDDYGGFIGGTRIQSSAIRINFKDGQLYKVTWLKSVDGTMTPLTQVSDPRELKLRNFRWEEKRRPKTKASLILPQP
ncbi:OstA-like protein [Compostibacter hankyongensis]